ncbi:MAG: 2-iminoacetate synthase ThiH [Verrucomicrobiota bacterium]|jgi:2-iminoacetate synthase|nr:2-iminoacetate synthase ThiH [Verrucomicrobiota bacterium]MDD8046243.1 2-iminoacetate synthase ThiH [Verrucomicrobiota bacterium]MDD8051383.1 2-iminoacetate synthase ThiH [Verrucomicrobiota bacterium]MDI9383435.1 2-iminoacetate synthase ThiH [Verrucomicrobiota bacterium]
MNHPFVDVLDRLPIDDIRERLDDSTPNEVRQAIALGPKASLEQAAALFSPAAATLLEEMAQRAHLLSLKRFGRVIQLYAPIYLSNECVNVCKYCGFSAINQIPRITLTVDRVEREADHLIAEGFQHILLVSGEHPRHVPTDYIVECIDRLRDKVASISIEVAPFDEPDYARIVQAGCEGLILYQETYHRPTYAEMHPKGYKRNFNYRLETLQRGANAGMKRLGMGFLLGLAEWRREAICMLAHARHLQRHCWRSQLSVSFPRLRPAAGEFEPIAPVPDPEFVQLITALRILLPEAGLTISTRESPFLREHLLALGVTWMSAGSKTEPGGYEAPEPEGEQFHIADERPAHVVAQRIRDLGYEAVWKDWDSSFNGVTTLH